MNGEKDPPGATLGTAFAAFSVTALTLVLMASLLARAGMPFIATYTISIAACIVGTLAVSHGGRTLIALPSPAITAWLVYEEIIAHGLSWQEMLGIAVLVSLVGAALMRTKYADTVMRTLPPVICTGLVLNLGLGMLLTAALYARILLPSPWALSMGGTLSDPLTYYTLLGIFLTLLLYVRDVYAALPLSMLLIALLTWMEGFWEIPAAPFFTPDPTSLVCALTLPQNDLWSAAACGTVLLLALVVESTAVLAVQAHASGEQPTLARLFAVSGGAALFGAFPLTIAPLSLALPTENTQRAAFGIPRTALLTALLLLLLLPCAPLMQALAEFPAVPAMALAVLGLRLLVRGMEMMKSTGGLSLHEGAVLATFLLTAYDIKTGLTLALVLRTLLTAARGETLVRGTLVLTTLLALLALLKWIL